MCACALGWENGKWTGTVFGNYDGSVERVRIALTGRTAERNCGLGEDAPSLRSRKVWALRCACACRAPMVRGLLAYGVVLCGVCAGVRIIWADLLSLLGAPGRAPQT